MGRKGRFKQMENCELGKV